jgi:hypothetical protein
MSTLLSPFSLLLLQHAVVLAWLMTAIAHRLDCMKSVACHLESSLIDVVDRLRAYMTEPGLVDSK